MKKFLVILSVMLTGCATSHTKLVESITNQYEAIELDERLRAQRTLAVGAERLGIGRLCVPERDQERTIDILIAESVSLRIKPIPVSVLAGPGLGGPRRQPRH